MPPSLSPFGNAVVGAVGGVVSGAVVYPLDTLKTRIQTEVSAAKDAFDSAPPPVMQRPGAPNRLPRKHTSARQMIFRILKEGGPLAFYRGFGASMLNTFSTGFSYFYFYTLVRSTFIKRFPTASLNTVTELILGALAAALAQLFTIPVSVIATRQQLATKQSLSFRQTLHAILADDGITGLWRGLKPSLVLCINPAITYGMFERLKVLMLKEGEKMTPGKAFIIGALSKTMATVVTYPYIMAKTRLQAGCLDDVRDADGKKKDRYSGAIDCLRQVYRENGFVGWYQGMQAQITKAVLSQALLFGIKDALEAYTIAALVAASKTRGSAIGLSQI
ncbi:hypothetical protein JCM1841_002287 [Sporobolomyces salmonicolor]